MSSWIESYRQASVHRVVGLMSGTSVDGIDAACVRISGSGPDMQVELESFQTVAYPPKLKQRVLSLCRGGDVTEVALLNFRLGEAFADAALALLGEMAPEPGQVDLIGSHGQTVAHLPRGSSIDPEGRATLQLGEPSVIAERTGIATVADFRPRDIAAGGEGAPLIPYVDFCLLRHPTKHRIVQNIGGIANCTVLPAGCTVEEVQAWDTGPGNMVIDECIRFLTNGEQELDADGAFAAQGQVNTGWLEELLRHQFLQARPPKSAGREEFGRAYAESIVAAGRRRGLRDEDIVATITALTAASIAASYQYFAAPHLPDQECTETEVVTGGGGAHNLELMRMLQHRLAPWRLLRHEECGIDGDAKEAMGFAILAHETIMGSPSNVPGGTGASRSALLGKIVPGRAW
jgi:anhydro-N-acetylmuramic acid kinase